MNDNASTEKPSQDERLASIEKSLKSIELFLECHSQDKERNRRQEERKAIRCRCFLILLITLGLGTFSIIGIYGKSVDEVSRMPLWEGTLMLAPWACSIILIVGFVVTHVMSNIPSNGHCKKKRTAFRESRTRTASTEDGSAKSDDHGLSERLSELEGEVTHKIVHATAAGISVDRTADARGMTDMVDDSYKQWFQDLRRAFDDPKQYPQLLRNRCAGLLWDLSQYLLCNKDPDRSISMTSSVVTEHEVVFDIHNPSVREMTVNLTISWDTVRRCFESHYVTVPVDGSVPIPLFLRRRFGDDSYTCANPDIRLESSREDNAIAALLLMRSWRDVSSDNNIEDEFYVDLGAQLNRLYSFGGTYSPQESRRRRQEQERCRTDVSDFLREETKHNDDALSRESEESDALFDDLMDRFFTQQLIVAWIPVCQASTYTYTFTIKQYDNTRMRNEIDVLWSGARRAMRHQSSERLSDARLERSPEGNASGDLAAHITEAPGIVEGTCNWIRDKWCQSISLNWKALGARGFLQQLAKTWLICCGFRRVAIERLWIRRKSHLVVRIPKECRLIYVHNDGLRDYFSFVSEGDDVRSVVDLEHEDKEASFTNSEHWVEFRAWMIPRYRVVVKPIVRVILQALLIVLYGCIILGPRRMVPTR